ncbi:MAG: hypothetical protein FWC77_05065 [Defluviitaleaceae bacterium]|nr:hypothetical protein [Defluviitaleaceae bacterium]
MPREKGTKNKVRSIDTYELTPGFVAMNYKHLCEVLGDEVLDGDSKKSQLADWQNYFSYKRKGNRYIIVEVYPFPKVGNKDSYKSLIQSLVMCELSKRHKCTSTYTARQLFIVLGMVNSQYDKDDVDVIAYTSSIPREHIVYFFSRSEKMLKYNLFYALDDMVAEGILQYDELRMIVIGNEHVKANAQQVNDIKAVEKEVRSAMGYANKKMPPRYYGKYYRKVSHKLNKLYGWNGAYKKYILIGNSEKIKGHPPIGHDDFTTMVRDNRKELNDRVLQGLNKQTHETFADGNALYQSAMEQKEYKEFRWFGSLLPRLIWQHFYVFIDSNYVKYQKELD